MSDQISLRYGNDQLSFRLPVHARILQLPAILGDISPQKFITDLSEHSPSFAGKSRIAVIVADKTRLCGYDRYLHILLDEILKRGITRNQITIHIAYGTHLPQSDTESRSAYGQAWSRFSFMHHNCKDSSLFYELGTTIRGTPVRIRKDICDADFLITFGAISHHYFAGYGGGRKLIFPGLGEQKAIYHNHSLLLDAEYRRLVGTCAPGKLKGNPLAEDLEEVASYRPADLSIHGILDQQGHVCRLIVGKGNECFQAACRLHGKNTEVVSPVLYDMVLASCGGFPKDINLIQSHKAIHHAAMFVKDGGTLVLLAQCRDAIGSDTFLPWFRFNDWEAAFEHLAANYQGNGGTALSLMAKLRRINIYLVTELDESISTRIGLCPLTYLQVHELIQQHQGTLAVIPNASLLVNSSP
ncbi:MAG: nickel-dependent lactate racemase [Desulfobacteraceae bacterium]